MPSVVGRLILLEYYGFCFFWMLLVVAKGFIVIIQVVGMLFSRYAGHCISHAEPVLESQNYTVLHVGCTIPFQILDADKLICHSFLSMFL